MSGLKLICLILWIIPMLGFAQTYQQSIEEHREHYKAEFLHEKRAPIKKRDLKKLRFFNPDSTFCVLARFERAMDALPFDMATYSGITKPYIEYGKLYFEINSNLIVLSIYQSIRHLNHPVYKEYLFIPFKDNTNGETTYGGGRYIDLKLGDIIDGKVTLDFNKSYNPWCAYSEGYNCPIPPIENHLDVYIEAGEQNYAGKKKK